MSAQKNPPANSHIPDSQAGRLMSRRLSPRHDHTWLESDEYEREDEERFAGSAYVRAHKKTACEASQRSQAGRRPPRVYQSLAYELVRSRWRSINPAGASSTDGAGMRRRLLGAERKRRDVDYGEGLGWMQGKWPRGSRQAGRTGNRPGGVA